ncbi:MAG TPA: FtsX-like permease family protein [Candidatus Acidoferrales bacterium]|nr:FtsX-like permease family protein [Candidatus Acidoferrales bacterium]
MFRRILFHLLSGNRVRLTVALLALTSGGAVISALLNLDLDVTRKLTQEFRSLGANIVISAPQSGASVSGVPAGFDDSALQSIEQLKFVSATAAPYLYLVAHAGSNSGLSVVVAGTWLDRIPQLVPWWKISGESEIARGDLTHCLIGRNAANTLRLSPGGTLILDFEGRAATVSVAGILDAGGPEDNQVFVNLPVAQKLTALDGKIQFIQMNVPGSAAEITRAAGRLRAALPVLDVKPIRQITEAEGSLLHRIRFLIVSTGILILVLTALCVLATMAALAMERRRDVGLMKALGGSIQKVVRLFLAEVGILGTLGGILGYALGMALSVWMGHRVFGTSISPRWEVLPITVALMFLVSFAGALPLRLLGNIRPAIILRGE